jgi:DNA anti-recombination protein RmuC
MNPPSSAREALIVEALGEVARLLDRVEALTLSVDTTRTALECASAQLNRDLAALGADLQVVAHHAKVGVVEHVLKCVNKATSDTMAAQARAMASAARLAFSEQADSNLARLNKLLGQVVHRVDRPWETWMTHVATAVASSLVTCCIYSWFTFR